MKRIIYTILALILLIMTTLIAIPCINDRTADTLEKMMLDTPLPDGAVLIDHASAAGKLIGNGNGMQYLAVLVIRSDLTADALEAHYAPLRRNSDHFLLVTAADADRLPFDRLDLLPQYPSDAYFVYSWGNSAFPLCDLDLRAH
ncbi:MAG: hypothetical protein IKL84_08315 [Clostridia bacterium]|nr:hypothetical protein [Clostridia bacterium]